MKWRTTRYCSILICIYSFVGERISTYCHNFDPIGPFDKRETKVWQHGISKKSIHLICKTLVKMEIRKHF